MPLGQQDIYDYLVKHTGDWFSSHQLAEELGISIGSVTMSLKKLRKTDMVQYKRTGLRNAYLYCIVSTASSKS